MLNIDDIKKLHYDFPEPPELKEIRNYIEHSFSALEFEPSQHKYSITDISGNREFLPSVSSIVSGFEKKANWDMIAEKYAWENNVSVEEIKRKWRENNIRSTNNGTSTHLFMESYMYFFLGCADKIDPVILPQFEDGWLIPYGSKQSAGAKYFEDLYNSFYDDSVKIKVYPVMPETRMYIYKDNKFGIGKRFAGTMDVLLAYCDPSDSKWYLICDDWKTNQDLQNPFNRSKKNMMLAPFNNYIDEPFSHYTIQLSAYSLMLNQLDLYVSSRNLVWLKENSTYERYLLDDVTGNLISALQKN